jgi:hypothetical protein
MNLFTGYNRLMDGHKLDVDDGGLILLGDEHIGPNDPRYPDLLGKLQARYHQYAQDLMSTKERAAGFDEILTLVYPPLFQVPSPGDIWMVRSHEDCQWAQTLARYWNIDL